MSAGGSARQRADELRAQAAAARAKAEALEREAGAWVAGAEGERRVGAALSGLPNEWHVLHDLLLRPGRSQVNLDHVVVGPAGVFLVDAKNWSGQVSVYDGTLWQHNGGHHSQRSALEQAARAAGEMENALGVPVIPVIALAGSAGAGLDPCRVGGVDIVPVARLKAWLRGQPVCPGDIEIEALLWRICVSFPSATGRAEQDSARPSTASQPRRVISRGSRNSRGGNGRRRGRRGALGKVVIALVVLAVAPRVLPEIARTVGGQLRDAECPVASPAACSALEAQIVTLLGSNVSQAPNPGVGQCRWSADSSLGVGPREVTLTLTSIPVAKATVSAQIGSAIANVPRGQTLAEWRRPELRAPLGYSVHVRYTYPASATKAERGAADASGLAAVIELSKAFAQASNALGQAG